MEKMRHTLEALIDCDVFAFIPMLRKDATVTVTIRNLESSGLWIENNDLSIGVRRNPTDSFQALEELPPTVCFIPWTQIAYILAGDAPDIRKRQLLHFSPKPAADQK